MIGAVWWQARAVAIAAARAAGTAALPYFRRSDLTVERKSDESPVTVADRAAEAAAKAVIMAAFPDDAWEGEETGTAERLGLGTGPVSGRRWIVDPIDGTRNFVRGIPFWSSLIACVEGQGPDERVVASAVGFPALDEWYDAVRGGGAQCNGLPIRVSQVKTTADAAFGYYTAALFTKSGLAPIFQHFSHNTAMQRGGADAYIHALVASGRLDFAIEPGLQVWDIAASSLLVEEAGGRMTDLNGTHSIRSGHAVLSNGVLHNDVVATIRRLGVD